MKETSPLVTPEDHDAGFKIIPVEFRSGKTADLRLIAPDHRTAADLSLKIAATKSINPAIEEKYEADRPA